MCGLFGVFGVEYAASLIYQGLFSQQHRGQEGAGIVVSDGMKVHSLKGQGLVSDIFEADAWDRLPGYLGIGHVRYSTTGSTRIQNVQPLVVECVDGIWAVAHNGNLVNAARLRRMYQEAGAIFQTSTDSEVLVHLLADPMYRSRPRRVARALNEIQGSFSFLIMTKDALMAARDPLGFKPLSIGRLGEGYVVASETCALNQIGAKYLRDVEPGELVTIDKEGLHSHRFAERPRQHLAQCVFEMVYFARPDSLVFGKNVHLVRQQYGRCLAREHAVDADIVIAIPDSGNSAALGYSQESGIPLNYGFIRNHYVGRTFIMPEADARTRGVDMKLAVLPEVVRDQRVVVVDDSIVRGTTARRRVACLREAGAKEIHLRISCPPTANPCFFGIDFPSKEELIAGVHDVGGVCEYLGADSLGYLSVEGLLSPFDKPENFCTACFTGDYPVDISAMHGKESLETHTHESNE
ncbi:MAG: amidophosphoribosyltransferase [Spartobacteria bacterium]|nr:amidophosphoribosyltransferase [Spartobacteria bacterium]